MMEPCFGGQRMSQRMASTKTLLKCDGSHHCRLLHLTAGTNVSPVFNRNFEIARNDLYALKCNRIRHRVIALRTVGLDAMCERIEARCSGHVRRHAHRQLRVENGHTGHELWRENYRLPVSLVESHYTASSDLASRSGCGRYR